MGNRAKVRTQIFSCRLTPKEHESFKESAKKLGLTITAYLVMLNERESKRIEIEQAS